MKTPEEVLDGLCKLSDTDLHGWVQSLLEFGEATPRAPWPTELDAARFTKLVRYSTPQAESNEFLVTQHRLIESISDLAGTYSPHTNRPKLAFELLEITRDLWIQRSAMILSERLRSGVLDHIEYRGIRLDLLAIRVVARVLADWTSLQPWVTDLARHAQSKEVRNEAMEAWAKYGSQLTVPGLLETMELSWRFQSEHRQRRALRIVFDRFPESVQAWIGDRFTRPGPERIQISRWISLVESENLPFEIPELPRLAQDLLMEMGVEANLCLAGQN